MFLSYVFIRESLNEQNLSMENFAPGKQEEKVNHENHYE
jgi:hypothetical protein